MQDQIIHILVDKRNPRIQYAMSEIFEHRLGMVPKILSDLDDFETQTGPKLNYSNQKTSEGIPTLLPSKVMQEKRIQPQEVEWQGGEEPKLFLRGQHPLGFDAIAAVFYLLTRYEEYLPHRNDEHGRYETGQSITVQAEIHQQPLVERFTIQLADWLRSHYSEVTTLVKNYRCTVTVDVDQLFSMKSKGLVRSMLGMGKDAVTGQLLKRVGVMIGRKDDPNEVYDRIIKRCTSLQTRPIFFFQVGDNSRFDVNNPPHHYAVRQRINEIALNSEVGVHPSYYSSVRDALFGEEIERLRNITTSSVHRSRQHYLRFRLPHTFHRLAELGVTDEYSIGYHDRNGFRAGTCHPFRLFDLEKDETLQITMHPTSWMDLCATRMHPDEADAWGELQRLIKVTKEFGGELVTTWHPEVLQDSDGDYSSWNIFERLIKHA